MENLQCTANQMLLLDKNEAYRNYTINMAVSINRHFDIGALLEALNKEIERNEGLRLYVYKKRLKWYNEIKEPYKVEKFNVIEALDKTDEEAKKLIDDICEKNRILKEAEYPFDLTVIKTKEKDYMVLRVFHVNMDAYAVLLTMSDILKVYFSIVNKTPLTDELTSVKEYLVNYNSDLERINKKIKEDTAYFIDRNKAIGEPMFLGCEGGYDGSKRRYKFDMLKSYPCKFYESTIDAKLSNKITNYCKENKISAASLFIGALELYYCAVNKGLNDVAFFYTSDFRAKLTEKALPITTATGILFRRIVDEKLSYKDFMKECDNDYIASLRHVSADIAKIYSYLIGYNLLQIRSIYHQLMYSFIPVDLSFVPDGIDIDSYLPKAKFSADGEIVYNFVIPNKDGTYKSIYRYYDSFVDEEIMKKLHQGVCTILDKCIDNPEIKISEIFQMWK